LDLVRPEGRLGQDVAQDLDADVQAVGRQAGVVGGVLAAGEGVHLAPDRVDRLRDLPGRPRGRALEQQVLEEVRGAGQLGRLVPTADADPDAERDRPGSRHPLGHDADAVVEPGLAHLVGAGGHGGATGPHRRRRRRLRLRPSDGAGAAGTGPRSPRSSRSSASKVSSKLTVSAATAVSASPPRSPPSPPPGAGGSETRLRETLPLGSMSSTRTSTSSPSSKTSSTRSTRVTPPIFEMCSRPSRTGRMLTNAPNFVTFTIRPR